VLTSPPSRAPQHEAALRRGPPPRGCLPPHSPVLSLPNNQTPTPRYRLPEGQVAAAVERALALVNMSEFMHRATHTLSGGQRQRVAIAGAVDPPSCFEPLLPSCPHPCSTPALLLLSAPVCRPAALRAFSRPWEDPCQSSKPPKTFPRQPNTAGALAEEPRVLLLDELTTFLDVEDQFGVLRAVRDVTHDSSARGRGVTAVWVTHRCGGQGVGTNVAWAVSKTRAIQLAGRSYGCCLCLPQLRLGN
jgi:hypothetical protein